MIIGWSSGAVAAMRYAEENKIKGSISISPSYTDLGDDMEKQSGYYDKAWNWEEIKAAIDLRFIPPLLLTWIRSKLRSK